MCGRESNPITDSPAALVSSSRLRVAAAPPRRRTSDPRRRQAMSSGITWFRLASLCNPGIAVNPPSHVQRRPIATHSVPSGSDYLSHGRKTRLRRAVPDASWLSPSHAGAVGAPAILLLAAHVRRTFLLPEPPQPARRKPPKQKQQAERIADHETELGIDAHGYRLNAYAWQSSATAQNSP